MRLIELENIRVGCGLIHNDTLVAAVLLTAEHVDLVKSRRLQVRECQSMFPWSEYVLSTSLSVCV